MIEEAKTGRLVAVAILPASSKDLKSLRGGWRFKWAPQERKSEVFKLIAVENPETVLGLMAIERKPGFIKVILLESSPPNVGKGKALKKDRCKPTGLRREAVIRSK